MKKILVGIVGLPRFDDNTVENFFSKLIEPNMAEYKFDIFINTENNGLETEKHGIQPNFMVDNLEIKLYDIFNRHRQVKNIIYQTKKDKKNNSDWLFDRFTKILGLTNEKYDYYV